MKNLKRWYRIVWNEARPFAWLICAPFVVVLNIILGALIGALEAAEECGELMRDDWKDELFIRARRREILRQRRDDT